MKKIFILLTLFTSLTSCEHRDKHNDETITKRVEFLGVFRRSDGGLSVYLYKIDGHDYGATYNGALTHLESCKLCNSKNDKISE